MPDPQSPIEKPTDIRALVEARRRMEQEALGGDEDSQEPGPPQLTEEFVELCMENNERGDGVLYATLMRDRFVNVKKRQHRPWLVWRKHHWEIDLMGEHIRAVEEVAVAYWNAAQAVNEPISREKELLSEANARVTAANNRTKELQKAPEPDYEALNAVATEGKQSELDAARHMANYKALQRKKKKFLERADRLRTKPGAEKCVWWAHHIPDPLAITGDDIDQKRMLLPCPNGVIDLTTGKLCKGRPRDYLLRSITVEYPEDLEWEEIRNYYETGENFWFKPWEDFIGNLVYPLASGEPDQEVALCLQKLLGNSITGDTSLHKIVITVGDGRNGKGVLFRTIEGIVGELAWTIKSELLLDQKQQRSTAGPSPEIMALRGRRLVVASETDKHRYISAARVKEFSGGDTINARDMFGLDEENFVPTHHLWLQTNNIPGGLFKEFSLRQRLVIFDFPYRYVDDPELEGRKEPHNAQWFRKKIGDLEQTLSAGKRFILLWLIRGAVILKRDGLQLPDKIRGDMEGMQLLEDHLEQFLRGCCLQEYDPDQDYEQGDLVNVPNAEDPRGEGKTYSAIACNRGQHPDESSVWRHEGHGLDPEGVTLFKVFYAAYKKWYEENVTDKKDSCPSSKNVAAEMRKKGFDVRSKGGQSKIFADIRIFSG